MKIEELSDLLKKYHDYYGNIEIYFVEQKVVTKEDSEIKWTIHFEKIPNKNYHPEKQVEFYEEIKRIFEH